MKKRTSHSAVVICVLLSAIILLNFSFEPPNGSTGAPGNLLCSGCHIYDGGNQTGSMEIAGIPADIVPLQTYPVEIRLIKTGGIAEFAGFEVIALEGNNFNSPSAGTWSNFGPNVNTSAAGFNRVYLKHFDGELEYGGGTGAETLTYTADWTAPAVGTDNIYFYGAGNISSLIGTDGDLIVTDVISSVLLPVDLISFRAARRPGPSVLLEWSTASELNSAAFEILRSRNGIDYDMIGAVAAQGEAKSRRDYQFWDRKAFRNGTSFYKLKMTDRDGKFHFSNIEVIRLEGTRAEPIEMNIYPNPARPGGCLFIDIEALEEVPYTEVVVSDLQGKRSILSPQFDRNIHEGLNRYVVDVAHLPSGMYTVTMLAGSRARATQKVIILPD